MATNPSSRIPLIYPCGEPPASGTAREIAPGVLWLRMPLPLSLSHINVWAVRDTEGWAIFDTGMHTEATVQAWRSLVGAGLPLGERGPNRVLATHMHPDHIGMAGWLTQEFDAPLWMTQGEYMMARVLIADAGHAAPLEHVKFYRLAGWGAASLDRYRKRFGGFGKRIYSLPQSYRRLRDGQTLQIGEHQWQVIVGAGHSPEHACFYCPQLKLLISGDQVLPRISSNVSVLAIEPQANPLDDWLQSLDKIKRQVPDDVLVLPAHDDPFHRLHARLDHLDRSQRRALDRLLALLSEGPKRVVDVFSVLFARRIDEDTLPLATGESLANLNYLIEQGSVAVTEDEEGVAWYRLVPAEPRGSSH
ncbi:MBL fold metallo-hydrolase [Pseudomonas sp. NPDC089569]|uniref:MBL fold metallo-hydrolase n=1 Tax=Pseudomonas sp. NPDC089569 TaxID=3390722 RepID=UPI003D01224F